MIERLRVLLVEPEEKFKRLIKYILLTEYNDVHIVELDSLERLDSVIEQNNFDLAISDVTAFSVLQGEIIQMLRKRLPLIPIIATYKEFDPLIKSLAILRGANTFLAKEKQSINSLPEIIREINSESSGVNWNRLLLPEKYTTLSKLSPGSINEVQEMNVLINEELEVVFRSEGFIYFVQSLIAMHGAAHHFGEINCLISNNLKDGCLNQNECTSGFKQRLKNAFTEIKHYHKEKLIINTSIHPEARQALLYSLSLLRIENKQYLLLSFVNPGEINQLKLAVLRNEEFNQRVVSSMAEGLIVLNEKNEIIDINNSALNLLQLTKEQIIGKRGLTEVFECFDQSGNPLSEEEMPDYITLKTGKSISNQTIELRYHGKTLLWSAFNTEPMFLRNLESPDAVVVTFTNISDLRQSLNRLMKYQKNLRLLAARLTIAEAQERRNIALNLHDYISQDLSLSRIKLNQALKLESSQSMKELLSETEALVTSAIRNSRIITNELSPPILFEMGLVSALKWKVEQENQAGGPDIELKVLGSPYNPKESVNILLYRSICELIRNVRKHAHASHIQLKIDFEFERISVSVTDDGDGFPLDWEHKTEKIDSGFGLFSIKERISYFGGTLHITSENGSGSEVILNCPVK